MSASVRPSRLGQLLAAAEALQPAETMIDSYAGLVRFGVPGAAGDMQAFAAEVEALGGATRVERAPDESRSDGGGRAGGREGVLVDRLRLAFDPEGALWPAR